MLGLHTLKDFKELLKEKALLIKFNIDDNTIIENITYNSKDILSNTLFACKGSTFKKEYLDEAIKNNAVCYLSETEYDTTEKCNYFIVSDVRKAMAYIASFFYNNCFNNFNLIGVTGTKGKSTTVYYIKYILDEYLQSVFKKPSGLISSINIYDGVIDEEAHLTTPEAFNLHKHFNNAYQSELEFLEMEISSQALKYDRVLGVKFDVSIFLNISPDHISPIEHVDFEDYFSSKLKLFSQTDTAVINLSSDYSDRILKASEICKNRITFGFKEEADVFCYDIKKIENETHFKVKTKDFDENFILTMPGLFNVENALAAISVGIIYNIPIEFIKTGLIKAKSSGRMEIYTSKNDDIISIVDYAHNKLSFEKLYNSVKQEYPNRSIITVFGCVGDKAYNRRRDLGRLSGDNSTKIYITMQHPGNEPVRKISEEIAGYVENTACEVNIIDNREEAIREAILNAESGSIIIVAGKGNERSQKIGSYYSPCEPDSAYVQNSLKLRDKVKIK